MELNWFTLIAQIINFVVLLWLLKRLLFARIVQAMNDREAKIAGLLEDAAKKSADAEQDAALYRTKIREIDAQREQLRTEAKEQAEAHRQQLVETARLEVEASRVQWFESLHREQQGLRQELRQRIGQQVFSIARRVLKELAKADLEEHLLKVFVERLQALDPAERKAIAVAIRDSDHEVEIRTAFPIVQEERDELSRVLRTQLAERIDVRFTTAPELMCGIELRAHSHRLVWNFDSYLEGLEDRVFEALDESVTTYATT